MIGVAIKGYGREQIVELMKRPPNRAREGGEMAHPIMRAITLFAATIALAMPDSALAGVWTQLAPSNVTDVAALGQAIYIVKTDGTIWHADNLNSPFRQIRNASGFSRIAGGNGRIYAVGTNGTLWRYQVAIFWPGVIAAVRPSAWTKLPFSNIADVDLDYVGAIWVTQKTGQIGLIADLAEKTLLTNPANPTGMRRIGAHYDVWVVNNNGNVWKTDGSYKFVARSPTGVGDAAPDQAGKTWFACKNGSIWTTWDAKNFVKDPEAAGFDSIADYPAGGGALAVGFNHTLWHYRQGADDTLRPLGQPPTSGIPC